MSMIKKPEIGLSDDVKVSLYWFVENLSKGLLDNEDWDFDSEWFEDGTLEFKRYKEVLSDPAVLKIAITVWSNNLELNEKGEVLNEDAASLRAFKAIRPFFDDKYSESDISPAFEDWEVIENEITD